MKKNILLAFLIIGLLIGSSQVVYALSICDNDLSMLLNVNGTGDTLMTKIASGKYTLTIGGQPYNVTIGSCLNYCQLSANQDAPYIYTSPVGAICNISLNITGYSQSAYNSLNASLNNCIAASNQTNITANVTCVPPSIYVNVTPTSCNDTITCPRCPDNVCQVSCYKENTTGSTSTMSVGQWFEDNLFWIIIIIVVVVIIIVAYFILRGVFGRRRPIRSGRVEPQGQPPAYEKLKKKEEESPEGPDFDYTRRTN